MTEVSTWNQSRSKSHVIMFVMDRSDAMLAIAADALTVQSRAATAWLGVRATHGYACLRVSVSIDFAIGLLCLFALFLLTGSHVPVESVRISR